MYTGSGRDAKSLNGYAERAVSAVKVKSYRFIQRLGEICFYTSRGTRPRTHGKSEENVKKSNLSPLTSILIKLELPGKRDTRGVLLNTRRHPR